MIGVIGVIGSKHPSDEELVLHYYGEAGEAGRSDLEAHLEGCPQCQAVWQDLSGALTLVTGADVPEPPAGFEQVMWARIQPNLGTPSALPSRRPVLIVGALAAALVALVAGAYVATRLAPPVPVTVAEDETTPRERRERVLLTALDGHLSQAEMLLVEIRNTTEPGESALSFERTTADDLVASGRLYRTTAEETGQMQFVQLLDDLEGVFVEVARSPETSGRESFQFLRTRIEDDDLLFKVRAVTADVRDRRQILMTQP